VAFDVGSSNWPLRASFVLFVRNVVEVARSHRESALSAPARSGDPIRLRVPLDVSTVVAEHPGGARHPIAVHSGLAVLPPPNRVGFVHVSWAGSRPGSVLVPTSLSSDAESRIGARPLPQAVARLDSSAARSRLVGLEWVFALLALALVALDVAWLTRRPRAKSLVDAARLRAPERQPSPVSAP
jgi:hypothetical protein